MRNGDHGNGLLICDVHFRTELARDEADEAGTAAELEDVTISEPGGAAEDEVIGEDLRSISMSPECTQTREICMPARPAMRCLHSRDRKSVV